MNGKMNGKIANVLRVLGLGAAVTAGVAVAWIARTPQPEEPENAQILPSQQTAEISSDVPTATEVSASVEGHPEATGAEQRIAELEAQLAALSKQQSEEVSVAEAERLPPPQMTYEEQVALEDQRVEAQVAYLEQSVATQGVDPIWSVEATAQIENALADAASSDNLNALDCRETVCRMELTLPGASGPETMMKIQQQVSWEGAGFVKITQDPPTAVVYLARSGYDLPSLGGE